MIYTLTFNPSLDYYVNVNSIQSGAVNRSFSERLAAGGKGLNVSLALKELGRDSLALAFVAGFTGNYICEKTTELGLKHEFFEVAGQSRINVKIQGENKTAINGTGADVNNSDVDKLVKRLKFLLKGGDWLIISGSVPPTLDCEIYANLMNELKCVEGVNTVVDARGKLLIETLKYKPFLIKPNLHEICEIFNLKSVPDIEGIFACARQLQQLGARNVIVSMGALGAAMVTEAKQSAYVCAPNGKVVNSVGAGDSLIAGFIHEYLNTNDCMLSLKYGVAAGSACAFTQNFATKEQIDKVLSLTL